MSAKHGSTVDASVFPSDTQDLLRLLGKHDVRYLIIGGRAVIHYGSVRVTGDIDIFYAGDAENVARLYDAMRDFWEGSIPGVSDPEYLMQKGIVHQYGVPPNRIDLMNEVEGILFAEAWPARVEVAMQSESGVVPILFIGLRELIKNKEAVGRPQDLTDLTFLRRAASRDAKK